MALGNRASIIRQHLIPEIETEDSGNSLLLLCEPQTACMCSGNSRRRTGTVLRKDRSSQSVDALRINFVEFVRLTSSVHSRPGLHRLSHRVAGIPRQSFNSFSGPGERSWVKVT